MPWSGISRAAAALAFFVLAANAQQATLSYLDTHPCCIAPDGHGNNFVVGYGAPASPAISVVKLDATGAVVSTFSFAAGPNDTPAAVTVDPQGNLWIACSPPHGSGSVVPMTALVVKVDPSGGSVVSQYRFGGTGKGETGINGIAFDPAGNVYLGGFSNQPDFPSIPATPAQYGFAAKLTPDFQPVYTFVLGGQLLDLPQCNGQCNSSQAITAVSAIAVDASGVATVAGITDATDFPTTATAFQTQCKCRNFNTNAFVARVNALGNGLLWSTLLGGSSAPSTPSLTLSGLAIDAAGNVVVTGTTSQSDFPVTSGVVQPRMAQPVATTGMAASLFNGFVSKLDRTGSTFLFSTYYGLLSHVGAPVLDSQGNVWITASPSDPASLPLSPDPLVLGGSLVAELSPDASNVIFSELLPNGVAGQTLAPNVDGSLTAAGIISAARSLSGTAVRLPQRTPAAVSILGVADSAVNSVSGVAAPGEYLSLYGTGLGPDSQVTFDGIPATVLYSSASQVNVLAPYEIGGSSKTTVRVVAPGGLSQPVDLQVVASHPNILVVLNADGTVNAPGNPAKPGSNISIIVSGAGLPDSLPPVDVTFSYSYFVPFSVQFGELVKPATVNLPQIGVQVPSSLTSPATGFTLSVQVGNFGSPEFPVYLGPYLP